MYIRRLGFPPRHVYCLCQMSRGLVRVVRSWRSGRLSDFALGRPLRSAFGRF